MSLPRPRSDRLGSADETLHQMTSAAAAAAAASSMGMEVWTPMTTVVNSLPQPHFNGSVASSSLRSESPMSPIQKLDHYTLEAANPRLA